MDNFKSLYAKYVMEKNIENENLLLKTIMFDLNFIICYKDEGNSQYLNAIRDENNKLMLKIYTNLNEIEEESKQEFSSNMESRFDYILDIVNNNLMDGIWINPQTDNFRLTNSQLMDLYRQINFNETYEPIQLHEEKDFLKPAYKFSEYETNSNKLMELYGSYLKTNDPNTFNDFCDELVTNATFFTLVLPEDNADNDENGNPLISKNRVLQGVISETERDYTLYISGKDILKNVSDIDENDYVAIFNFEDYINMIDSNWELIKKIRIIGDLDLTIPVEELNRFKVQKDRIAFMNDCFVINGQYANTEENQELANELSDYFSKIDNVEKAWFNLEIYMSKGKSPYKVFTILVKCTEDLESDIENELRKILKNKCFKLRCIREENNEETFSLIYEKKEN